MRTRLFSLGLAVFPLFATATACGGSEDAAISGTSAGAAGAGGGVAQSGGSAGQVAGGKSGNGGNQAGGASGTAGGSGTAGTAGKAGSAGAAGSAGKAAGGAGGGGAGGSTAGAAGKAGAGSGVCAGDGDCVTLLGIVSPTDCAVATCEPTSKKCVFKAKDKDGDGHATAKCIANNGTSIVVGDDCDDADKTTFPGAWDGPAGDGHAAACDGIDQDCNGLSDDAKTAAGGTCTCTPGDVKTCSADSSGKPITWPTGAPVGVCKYGAQTCVANGSWGPCTDAVVPGQESCNHLDDDCNGKVDDGPAPDFVPIDAQYYVYDGDDDGHAGLKGVGYPKLHICGFDLPTAAPDACKKLPLPCALGATAALCCPPSAWKIAVGIPQDDCDDRNPSAFPGAPELCGTAADDNCSGTANEGCQCAPGSSSECSATSTGQAITWPAGVPVGSCKFGSAMCGTNGQPGQCNGAVTPAGTDSCAIAGNDDNCNGTPNDGCSCINAPSDPSYTQQCSALPDGTPIVWPEGFPTGSCGYGTRTCQANGQYGQCIGAIAPAATDSCAVAGNDDNCNGTPNNACVCIASPGDASYSTTCSALPSGVAINWPGGTPQGSCHYGTATCQTNGTYGQCVGANAPLAADSCTIVGDDSNCNGIPNDGCDCIAVPSDPSYQKQCDAYPDGTAINFPGGTPKGTCKRGVAQCTSIGKYGPCNNAVPPTALDDCAAAIGRDTNCDGVVTCACTPIGGTSTTPCNQTGSCQGAFATCGPSGYGTCSVVPKAQDSCATGNDDNCDGVPNQGCACIAGAPGSCSALSDGTPIVFPGGTPKGNCALGTQTCKADGTPGQCNGAVAPQAKDSCATIGDDANCNGVQNDGCACVVGSASNTTSCSATAAGVPIVWPGGVPQGACHYGTATCQSTGTYGTCTGAQAPLGPAGTVKCGTAPENGSVTLTCPAGAVIVKVDFASYGNPSGSCGSFANGTCNATNTASTVLAACINKATCTVGATNANFGDPCLNTVKSLAIQVQCRGADDCTNGIDTNCDGIVSCPCSPIGNTTTVGCNQMGSCAGATTTCGPSGYGACTKIPKAADTCTAGNDDTCDGTPNGGCAHINGTPCGAVATCNKDGVWQGCTATGGCACSFAASATPAGAVCSYNNNTTGVCFNGGLQVCTGPNSGAVSCTAKRDPNVAVTGSSAYQSYAPPWAPTNYDWDCDGATEPDSLGVGTLGNACGFQSCAGSGELTIANAACQAAHPTAASCDGNPFFSNAYYQCSRAQCIGTWYCGEQYFATNCKWNTSTNKCERNGARDTFTVKCQ